jgi:hypothetical protein
VATLGPFRHPFYFFLALIWSGLYGAIAGSVGKTIGVIEDCLADSRSELRMWKRYPRMQTIFYLRSTIRTMRLNREPSAEIDRVMARYWNGKFSSPHPVVQIIFHFLFAIARVPFAAFAGLLEGPGVVWDDCQRRWDTQFKKKEPHHDF